MYKINKIGKLLILTTPIGNLGDITLRALECLRETDLVAAEDTRRTSILLKHFNISVPITSYHQNNEKSKTSYLLNLIKSGKNIVIVSDAGTPCLSDPGYLIVRDAVTENIEIEVIPGVSALTFAVVASAMPVDNFHFLGFLSPKKGKRLSQLERVKGFETTLFIYESPYRVNKLLQEIIDVLGETTPVALIREATKLHEETLRGTARNLLDSYQEKIWKGEFVVAINTRIKKNE